MKTVATVVELKPSPSDAESWCVRLHAEDVSEGERRAFAAWLQASPDHQAEYELCELTFVLSQRLAWSADLRATLRPAMPPKKDPTTGVLVNRGRRLLAAAAGVVVLLSALLVWQLTIPRYSTGIGEQKVLSLADGSTVELNTASSVAVLITAAERRVTLRRGEAFFSIAPDASRPFVVRAGSGEIRVLGTKFNVRLERDSAAVTLLQGRVRVEAAPAATGAAAIELLPGESARIMRAGPPVKAAAPDTARLTSWRERKIYFEREPLSKVLAEVNRYSEVQFDFADPGVGALRLTGVFRTGDTDSVAYALRESYALTTERRGARIQVRKNVRSPVGPETGAAY